MRFWNDSSDSCLPSFDGRVFCFGIDSQAAVSWTHLPAFFSYFRYSRASAWSGSNSSARCAWSTA